MAKIEMLITCINTKGLYKRGETYEVPEQDLGLFTPEYIRILERKTEVKKAPETRTKAPAKKTTKK